MSEGSGTGPPFEYKGGKIELDKEGRWRHEGVEITHRRTAELFSRSVNKHPDGGYCLEIGLERARIEVEDTPFMVREVDLLEDRAVITLNDGTSEVLDPATLRVGEENVLYCDVKDGEFPARFFRPAYYQLTKNLVETENGYAVEIGGRLWHIKNG